MLSIRTLARTRNYPNIIPLMTFRVDVTSLGGNPTPSKNPSLSLQSLFSSHCLTLRSIEPQEALVTKTTK